jgi:hypothetical protein
LPMLVFPLLAIVLSVLALGRSQMACAIFE